MHARLLLSAQSLCRSSLCPAASMHGGSSDGGHLQNGAGRGVEASAQDSAGRATRVRFGSVAHAEAALAPEQAARVRELAARLTEDSVVSVLVEAPACSPAASPGAAAAAPEAEQPLVR